ncbi:MAG: hypothetical protein ACTHN0_14305 [Aquihabitans sp.]
MGETGRVMPQATPAPPPAATVPEKPKGAIGIWIGILCIVGGVVLGVLLVIGGVRSFADGIDDLQRVPINGGGIVRIEDTGSQSVYAERPSFGSSGFSSGTSFSGYGPNVAIRVIGPDGQDIDVTTSSGSETYTLNQKEGVKIGAFNAPVEGEYRVVTRLQDNNGNWQEIAVGHALELSGLGAIAGGIFGGGLVVLIGIILVIVFAVRRSRSKKRINQASGPYPGAYGGPGGGWPVAPGYAPTPGYAPQAPAGYGAPGGAPTSPGWVPPPVAQPGPAGPGPTWSPPPPPAPAPGPTWQPPSAPPAGPPNWPGTDAPTAPAEPPTQAAPPSDPLAPPWQPPAGDPPASGGDAGSGS